MGTFFIKIFDTRKLQWTIVQRCLRDSTFSHLYPRNAMLTRYLLSLCVRLTVHLFVTNRLNVGSRKQRRVGTLVFNDREREFTFAICYRPTVCRLSVVCL